MRVFRRIMTSGHLNPSQISEETEIFDLARVLEVGGRHYYFPAAKQPGDVVVGAC